MNLQSAKNVISSLFLFAFLLIGCFHSLNGQNCFTPTNASVNGITPVAATVNWDAMPNATAYEVNYRPMNAPSTLPWTTLPTNTNSLSITGLTPSTMYSAQIRSVCGPDFSNYTVNVDFSTQSCVPPGGLSAVNLTANTADLQWNVAQGASAYQFLYRVAVSNPGAWNTIPVSGTSYQLTGLAANTLYAARLLSDCGGNLSDTSKVIYFSTNPCSVPNHLIITAQTASSISLTWDAVPNATQYNVQYHPAESNTWTTVNANTNSKTVNGLTGNSLYEFRVRSRCSQNEYSAYTLPVNGFTLPCAMPENAVISNVTVNSVTINWNNATGSTQYRVEYKKEVDPNWTTVNANNTTKTINNLDLDTEYQVRVRSKCTGNQFSAYTDTLEFRTKSCVVPQGLEAVSISFTSARIQWNSVQNATRYQLQYRLLGDTSWTTVNPDSNIKVVNGLTPDSQYEVRVRSKCANNVYSDYSGIVVFSTALCGMPQGLQITEVSYTSVKFSWDGVNNAAHYQAEYRIIGDTVWQQVSSDSTYRYLNNLVPNTQYEARVRSRCANNVFSGWNESIFFETRGCTAPRNIMGGYRSNTSIELIWDGSPSAQLYQIGYRLEGDTVWTHQVNSDSNRKSLNNLTLGNIYEVRIRSKCASGVFSDWVSTSVIHMESCSAPTNLQVVQIDSLRYRASWNRAGDSLVYVFSYLSDDLPNRVNVYTQDTFLIITHWNPCTQYDYWLYAACSPEQKSRFLSRAYQTTYILPCANHAPVGVNDHMATWYDQPITYNVFNNDVDADNDSLYFDPLNPPYLDNSPGQIIANGRQITYIPDTTNYQNYALIIYTPYDGRKRGQKTPYFIKVNKTNEEDECSCNRVPNGNFEQLYPYKVNGGITYGGAIRDLEDYEPYAWLSSGWADILDKRSALDFWKIPFEFLSQQNINVGGNRAARIKALNVGNSNAADDDIYTRIGCLSPGKYKLTFKAWSASRNESILQGEYMRVFLQCVSQNFSIYDPDNYISDRGGILICPSSTVVPYTNEMTTFSYTFEIENTFIDCATNGNIQKHYLHFQRRKPYGIYHSSIVIDDVCLTKETLEENCKTQELMVTKEFVSYEEINNKLTAKFKITVTNVGTEPVNSLIIKENYESNFIFDSQQSIPQGTYVVDAAKREAIISINNSLTSGQSYSFTVVFNTNFKSCSQRKNTASVNNLSIDQCEIWSSSSIEAPHPYKYDLVANTINICKGAGVELTFKGNGPIISGLIEPIGQKINLNQTITIYPESTTTYLLTGVDAIGCKLNISITIRVLDDISLVYLSPQVVCSSAIFSGELPKIEGSIITNPSPLQINYSWQPATYLSSTTVANPIFQNLPNIPTTVTYTLTAWAGACTTSTQVTVNFVPPPVITVQNISFCVEQSGLLSASSPTGVLYSWSPITGLSNPNIPNPTVTLQNTGTYTYTVTVQGNPYSCSSTANVMVTVLPSPTITIYGPDKLCPDSDDEIAVTSTPLAEYYTVNTPTGSFNLSPDQPYFRITPTQTTTYTITGYIGNCSDTKTKTVIVPDVSISYPSFTICPNQPTTLTPTFVGQDVRYYSWSPQNGLNDAFIQNPIFTPSESGTYDFIVTVSTQEEHDFYCTTTAKVTVVVKDGPTVSITGAPSQAICPGQNVALTATGNPEGGVYTWSHGLGHDPTVNVTPNQTTTYTVTYEQNGCSSTATAKVTVTDLSFQLNVPVVCVGPESVIISLVPPPDNTYTVTWALNPSFPLIDEGNPSERRFFAFQEGTYTITATISKGSCSVTKVRTFNVGTPPPLLVSPSVTVACGGSRTLTATGATNYQWIAPPFQIIGTQSQVTVNPQTTTTYTVIGSNASGCTTSATVKVTVVNEVDFTEDPQNVCERYTRRTFCVTNPDLEATYTWRFIENNPNLFFFNGQTIGTCITVLTTDVTIPYTLEVTKESSPCGVARSFNAPFPTGQLVLSDFDIHTSSDLVNYVGGSQTITPVNAGVGTIVINGRFIIDSDEINFQNLNILVRNNDFTNETGSIVFDNSQFNEHQLRIFDCYIHSDLIPYYLPNSTQVIGIRGQNFWDGIENGVLEIENHDIVFVDRSQIEHAKVAVGLRFPSPHNVSGLSVIARNSCFNQNLTHLAPGLTSLPLQLLYDDQNINTNGSISPVSSLVLSACRLDCNAPLPGVGTNYTRIGIHLIGKNDVVGSPFSGSNNLPPQWASARNTFTRMSCGILAAWSRTIEFPGGSNGKLYINNNDFFDLIADPNYPIQATAVFFSGKTYANEIEKSGATVLEMGYHASNVIKKEGELDQTQTGVWINGTLDGASIIKSNSFINIQSGIKISDLVNHHQRADLTTSLTITNNNFNQVRWGVDYIQNVPIIDNGDVTINFHHNTLRDVLNIGFNSMVVSNSAPNIIVNHNDFLRLQNNLNISPTEIVSIRSSPTPNTTTQIQNNRINPNGTGNPSFGGVWVAGDHGGLVSITSNLIRNITGDYERIGEIGQPNINIPYAYGIKAENCPHVMINSNMLTNISTNRAAGIHLTACSTSTVSCNRIGEYNFGILAENASLNSTLTSNVLRFNASNYADASALTLYNNGDLGTQGSPNGSNYNMLSWCPQGTAGCYGALSIETIPISNIYVRQYSGLDNNGLNYSDDYYTYGIANQRIGGFASPITLNTINVGEPNLNNRCGSANNEDWLTFIDATYPTGLETLVQGNYSLALFDEAGKYMNRQYVYDSLERNPALRLQSAVLDSFYQVSKVQNLGRLAQIKQLISTGQNSQAEGLNNGIVPQNKIEENHQQVNAIYFDWIRRYQTLAQRHSTISSTGSFISVEQSFKEKDSLKLALKNDYYTTLIQISEQCPLYGGKAVYEARALRTQFEETLHQYPDACIERLLPKTESSKTSVSVWDISMYPNPARDAVTIQYQFPEGVICKVELLSVAGSRIAQFGLNGEKGVTEFSLSNVTAGMYLLHFHLSNGNKITRKLVVQN